MSPGARLVQEPTNQLTPEKLASSRRLHTRPTCGLTSERIRTNCPSVQQDLTRAQSVPVVDDRDVWVMENQSADVRADLYMWLNKVQAAECVLGVLSEGGVSGVSVSVDGQGKSVTLILGRCG
ncbi:hypothetical protein [Rothia sp. P4278]|uniref:hypothetical protein n=1 Tax=Rothia sp. P4278 TaxID=3402658 RepID=UPI003AE51ADD